MRPQEEVKFLLADGGHECETVRDAGFNGKENGELLAQAEEHLDVLVRNKIRTLRYQARKHERPEHHYLDHPPSFERSG